MICINFYGKRFFAVFIFLMGANQIFAQQTEAYINPVDTSLLTEVVVSSVKFPEKKKNIVQRIDIISENYIRRVNTQNTGDLLQSTGNIFVQKSQQGGSSPVIRGFEASRILLIVDGVRLNNAIYRSGHLQNVITVDQNMLERAEVMYGPASVLHGSDALGGAIAFTTKSPGLSGAKKKILYKANTLLRYSTVNHEKTGHADINIGGNRLGFLLSGTYSNFVDMRMGSNYLNKYTDFGRRKQYIITENNTDRIVANDDDRKQIFSGYKQWDFLAKLLFKQSEKINHVLNVQTSNSTNVPRYDRLQDVKDGMLRFANWYYGPQKRSFFAYEFSENFSTTSSFKLGAAYQDIYESRHQRSFKSPTQQHRFEHIKVWSAHADYRKIFGKNEISIGADLQMNNLSSVARTENIITGAIGKLDTRFPDGLNRYNTYGVFVSHVLKIKNGKWVINDGIRIQTVYLHSTLADTSVQFRLPFSDIRQSSLGMAANIGLVYMPVKDIRATWGISSGFRAPNIDDVAKIFESNTASKQLIIPNPNLKPEKTINFETGITKIFGKKITVDLSAFYTIFDDAIAYAPDFFNGRDSVIYNGVNVGVKSSQNVAGARLYGFSNQVKYNIIAGLMMYGSVNYTYGNFKRASGEKVPLDHIPPVYGKAGINYTNNKFSTEVYMIYNGWKKITRFNPDGEDNQQYATPAGSPSWTTLNWKGEYLFLKKITLQLSAENITDRNYRVFASGFSAPGFNLVLGLRAAL